MKTNENETRNAEAVTIPRAEYEAYQTLKEENAELSRKVDWLMERLRLNRQKRFGASSEKSSDDALEQLSLLFDEAEVYAEQEKAEPVAVAAHVRKRRSGSVQDVVPEDRWWSTGCPRRTGSAPSAAG